MSSRNRSGRSASREREAPSGAWALLLLGATACAPAPRDQATGKPAGERSASTFTSDSCGVSFSHPADWMVLTDSTLPNESCQFSLRPRDWEQRVIADDSVDAYGISIRLVAVGILSQVAESGFERRGDRWVVLGRQQLPSAFAEARYSSNRVMA